MGAVNSTAVRFTGFASRPDLFPSAAGSQPNTTDATKASTSRIVCQSGHDGSKHSKTDAASPGPSCLPVCDERARHQTYATPKHAQEQADDIQNAAGACFRTRLRACAPCQRSPGIGAAVPETQQKLRPPARRHAPTLTGEAAVIARWIVAAAWARTSVASAAGSNLTTMEIDTDSIVRAAIETTGATVASGAAASSTGRKMTGYGRRRWEMTA